MTVVSLPGHWKDFTPKEMGSHWALLRKEVI